MTALRSAPRRSYTIAKACHGERWPTGTPALAKIGNDVAQPRLLAQRLGHGRTVRGDDAADRSQWAPPIVLSASTPVRRPPHCRILRGELRAALERAIALERDAQSACSHAIPD